MGKDAHVRVVSVVFMAWRTATRKMSETSTGVSVGAWSRADSSHLPWRTPACSERRLRFVEQKPASAIQLEAKRWMRRRSSCSDQWPHRRAWTLAFRQCQLGPISARPCLVLHLPWPPFHPEDQPCFPYRIGGLSRCATPERPFPFHLLSTGSGS